VQVDAFEYPRTTEKEPLEIRVREGGLEPPSLSAPDPKSGASASFATLAQGPLPKDNAGPAHPRGTQAGVLRFRDRCVYGAVMVNVTPMVYVPGLSVSQ
jgi:hypothetical protein